MNESTLVPREEMGDLDWLARNVHEWKGSERCISVCNGVIRWTVGSKPTDGLTWLTKKQWLARRAELQNKPSWKYVPDWVMWISQDGSGNWWIYETEPKSILDCRGGSHWSCNDGSCESLLNYSGEVLGDHLDTLEKRPCISMVNCTAASESAGIIIGSSSDLSESAVTARLTEATENVLAAAPELMTDKYKFEPFVSAEDAATAKQPAPKGIGSPILGMVLTDLTNRALEGKEKYGEPLLANNGRNPLWDAYQEALDLAMYLRQAIEEQSK